MTTQTHPRGAAHVRGAQCESSALGAASVVLGAGEREPVRWREGERLHQLFEDRCDRLREQGQGNQLAVDTGDVKLTYDELDNRANRLARHLATRGVAPGHRVALLLDQPVHSYVAMLAVLKLHAAYVPLDVGYPSDRLAFITHDAGVGLVLSLTHLRERLPDVRVAVVCLDEVDVTAGDGSRLSLAETPGPADDLCYIIYTSGSTGRPKGVGIEHASICNFVRVAAETYGLHGDDRVYQGMTIAFDFSVEEIWVPWIIGATLVPKPGVGALLGQDLRAFLELHDITALCCVPTLLATLNEEVAGLRFLLVSGEACPQDLVVRWHQCGRRFLNVYGPTEATVTATWAVLDPERPVTLGVPLPTYSVMVLDPDHARVLPPGDLGEIGIAGIGLARGYVNRDDLTARAFIPDFLGIENNPGGRIYRTGDLGRINANGEVEYHGRIDTQVKIRGYRIELAEIESVLLQVAGIYQAVVDTYEADSGLVELVAYYSLRQDTAGLDPAVVYRHLRERLPAYMVPAYLEELAVIPMLPSDKADRKNLPPPRTRLSPGTPDDYTAPSTPTEEVLADALAAVLGLEQVSADSHFFDDLGANSLLLAHFCARVRRGGGVPSVAMRDVYQHPTIQQLGRTLESTASAASDEPVDTPRQSTQPVARASTTQYFLCGGAQFLLFLGATYVATILLHAVFEWISAGSGWVDYWQRAAMASVGTFLLLSLTPVVAKWVLVGRWHPQEIPVWGWAYLRFWVVKTLVRSSPLRAFVGSPLYVLYLRALGAKIGKDVVILSATVPVCTDLLTIGEGTVIRKDASLACYRAHAGVIQTGRVTLGHDVLVCEATVLDVDTSMGDGSQLGHSSSLHSGQAVPQGEHWHGSPARPTDVEYRRLASARSGMWRKVVFSALQLATALLILGPLLLGLAAAVPTGHMHSGQPVFTSWIFYRDLLVTSVLLFSLILVFALGVVGILPRLLNHAFRPGRVYPLYGFHYMLHRTIAGMTNSRFFMEMFGDSSYIVHYLRWLGYDLGRVQQTGSNFGVAVKHESPFLSEVGTGTMVSDGLSIVSADYSSTSFRLSRTRIGANNFLGNNIAYPSGGRTGDDCLLATKVMVPLDGPLREGVGLLGSPPFEIPRSVMQDSTFDAMKSPDQLRPRLAAKNRHNAVTIGAFLVARWGLVFALLLLGSIGAAAYGSLGALGFSGVVVLTTVVTVGYLVLVERAALAFRALEPLFCSIYDRPFWRHERYWKLSDTRYLEVFNGTPFKNVIWRLLGVRIGRRVFDDGCAIPEKSLVRIGHDCTLNALSTIQCHSMEDGSFKLQGITIDAGCTLGVNAFVHYGVMMSQGATLEADSFLMKGEEVEPQGRWGGNPARELPSASVGARPTTAGPAMVSTSAPALAPTPRGAVLVASSASTRETLAAPTRPTRPTPPAPASARGVLNELRAAPPGLPHSSGVTLSIFALEVCRGRESELAGLLGDEERDQASSLRSPVRRSTFVVSRAVLRLLLTADWRPDVAPQDWRIGHSAAGKLKVLRPEGSDLDVSISHTEDALAVAVSTAYDVGVDVEPMLRREPDPVVWSSLSQGERARLAATPEGERVAQFLRIWTLKEAYTKCTGVGSALDFRRIETSLEPLRAVAVGEHHGGRHDYWFHQEVWTGTPAHHWVSVVARTKKPDISCCTPLLAALEDGRDRGS